MIFWMFLSTIISIVTLAAALQRSDAPKSRYFILVTLGTALYSVGRVLESSAVGLEAALSGVVVSYIGLPFIPVAMLLFLIDYYEIKIDTRPLMILWLLPFATAIIVAVPELRHLYYTSYYLFPGPPISQVMVEGSTLYYVMFWYHLVLNLACLVLAIWGAVRFGKNERASSFAIFFAVLLPMLAEVLYILRLTPMQLEVGPIALCISVGLLFLAVNQFNLLRVLPLAKSVILEKMIDTFILVDPENRFLDANAAAKQLFPNLNDVPVGERLDLVDLFTASAEGADGRVVLPIAVGEMHRHYLVTETKIEHSGKIRCICYALHDVTQIQELMTELKTMATYDALTNIYNRASFYKLSNHELDRAREQRTPVSALSLDIDHFKEINDTYGHFCGDEVIKHIVNAIAGRLRVADIFGRVGGDEFNILLPNTNAENAVILAQDLRKMVNSKACIYEEREIFSTISIGIAVFDEQRHENLEQFLMDVDSALYASKKSGRNKVEVFDAD